MKKSVFFLILVNVIMVQVVAQLNLGGIPFGIRENYGTESIPIYKTKGIDLTKLRLEDIQDSLSGVPPRFGYDFGVSLGIENSGVWKNLSNGDRLWQLRVQCSNSLSINFIFDKYHLNEGSKLFIYSVDKRYIIGAFSDINNKGNINAPSGFGTGLVYGSDVIIELYQPKNNFNRDKLTISKIIHGYRYIRLPMEANVANKTELFGDAGACQVNINCLEGNNWQNEKRGVAMILVGGTRWCTGSLVNNTANNGRLLFLTANHCLNGRDAISNPNATDWSFWWDYESPTCTNPTQEPNSRITNGATVLANNGQSDFALLELAESPLNLNPPVNIYYNGWSRTNNPNTGGVGIHHPRGDIKKISAFTADPVPGQTYSAADHWSVTWVATVTNSGVTERGSSGSPLFLNNRLIIGQLHGGPASCSASAPNRRDEYGRLSVSWNSHTDNRRRLMDWLDPIGANPQQHGGGFFDQCAANVVITNPIDNFADIQAGGTITASGTIGANANVTMTAANSVILNPGFNTVQGSSFVAQIAPCQPRVIPPANKKDVEENENSSVTEFLKFPVLNLYPNPTQSIITIEFTIPNESNIEITVSDIQGKKVAELPILRYQMGSYSTMFDFSNFNAGTYFVYLKSENYNEIKKVIITN